MICDQQEGTVVHVADGSASAVDEYLGSFDEQSRAAVETVAMDMWLAWLQTKRGQLPTTPRLMVVDWERVR